MKPVKKYCCPHFPVGSIIYAVDPSGMRYVLLPKDGKDIPKEQFWGMVAMAQEMTQISRELLRAKAKRRAKA